MNQNIIEIYTDGGCIGNPGPGGWAYIIICGKDGYKASGCDKATTNNKMELTAVIEALKTYKKLSAGNSELSAQKPIIHTDSTYVKNGITTWIKNWLKNGWKTANKEPVKNKELWIALKELSDIVSPEWKWVKGHAGNRWNEECDLMVKKEMKNC